MIKMHIICVFIYFFLLLPLNNIDQLFTNQRNYPSLVCEVKSEFFFNTMLALLLLEWRYRSVPLP